MKSIYSIALLCALSVVNQVQPMAAMRTTFKNGAAASRVGLMTTALRSTKASSVASLAQAAGKRSFSEQAPKTPNTMREFVKQAAKPSFWDRTKGFVARNFMPFVTVAGVAYGSFCLGKYFFKKNTVKSDSSFFSVLSTKIDEKEINLLQSLMAAEINVLNDLVKIVCNKNKNPETKKFAEELKDRFNELKNSATKPNLTAAEFSELRIEFCAATARVTSILALLMPTFSLNVKRLEEKYPEISPIFDTRKELLLANPKYYSLQDENSDESLAYCRRYSRSDKLIDPTRYDKISVELTGNPYYL